MKIIDLISMNFKQMIRDKRSLFFLLLFPIIFMLIFGFAYGGDSFTDSTINLALVNLDSPHDSPNNFSKDLVSTIKDVESDNSTKIFEVKEINSIKDAEKLVYDDSVSLMVIIPENFSDSVYSGLNGNDNGLGNIIVRGNPSLTEYGIGQNVLNSIISQYSNELIKKITGSEPMKITLNQEDLKGTSEFTLFDYAAPGLMVFAILMTITTVTSNIAKETENGMLKRLKLSKMKTRDYVLGNLISWSLIGAIQIILLLIVAVLMGFHWQGGINSLIIACVIGILATISSVAVALIIVSLAKNESQATNIAPLIAVPLSFLVGSFFPLPDATIGTINGYAIQVYEILPWNQAITAIREVLTFGYSLNMVLNTMILILFMGIILMIISIILFNRKLSREF